MATERAVQTLCVLAICFGFVHCIPLGNGTVKYPVVMVPGDGGSQFLAKLNKPQVVHYFCSKTTKDYFPLWLNLELIVPYVLDCLVDNMRLVYDNKTRTTSNSPGVIIQQPGFGNSSTVEWLDSSQHSATSYFYHIAQALVDNGLKRDVSLRGAPYDFRKAPNEMQDFIHNLVTLVEDTYRINNNRKVVLLGHSMGNPYTLYMLNHQPQEWKDKYIQTYISLAGPWGGAAKPLRLMASGDSLDMFIVNPLSARPQQRSMTSTAWLMPSNEFWKDDEILVFGPTRNYTIKDYKQFFDDIKFPDGYLMWEDTKDLINPLTHPGVSVHCMHGKSVKTPAQFRYKKSEWPDYPPDVIFGDGDGTVNIRSLLGCERWKGKAKYPVDTKVYDGVTHLGMLKDAHVIQEILDIVSS